MQFALNSMKVWMLSWLIISLNRFCACKYVEGTLKTREVCIYLLNKTQTLSFQFDTELGLFGSILFLVRRRSV